jgi:hypothetical protein
MQFRGYPLLSLSLSLEPRVLGIELRASHMLGKHSTIEPCSQYPTLSLNFETVSISFVLGDTGLELVILSLLLE